MYIKKISNKKYAFSFRIPKNNIIFAPNFREQDNEN
jgi:hypothetical protein